MPLIRLDDNGNDLDALKQKKEAEKAAIETTRKEIKRRKNALKAITISGLSYLGCLSVFFFYNENLAILLGILPLMFISGLNLVDD